jgi:hypothetical protein
MDVKIFITLLHICQQLGVMEDVNG